MLFSKDYRKGTNKFIEHALVVPHPLLEGYMKNRPKRAIITITTLSLLIFFVCSRANASGPYGYRHIGIYGNYGNPNGYMANSYRGSFSGGIKAGISIGKVSGIEFSFSDLSFSGSSGIEDQSVGFANLSLFSYLFYINKTYFPYASIGVGQYKFENIDTKTGMNCGIGLLVFPEIKNKSVFSDIANLSKYSFDITYIFHNVDIGRDTSFFEVRAGINYYFDGWF